MEITNDKLVRQLRWSNALDAPTEQLCKMLYALCNRILNNPQYEYLTYREEFVCAAFEQCIKQWRAVKLHVSLNAYAFFVTVIKCSAIRIIHRKQREQGIEQ